MCSCASGWHQNWGSSVEPELAQELGLMVTSRWSDLPAQQWRAGWENYFRTLYMWQHSAQLSQGIHRGMFCPTSGWLCRWQDLWVWPLDTDHLTSSPLYIFQPPTWSDRGDTENMIHVICSSSCGLYLIERSIVGLLFMQIWLVQTNFEKLPSCFKVSK